MVLKTIAFTLPFYLLFACSGTSGTGAYEQEETSEPVDAQSLYVLHCESCHGMDGDKGTSNAAKLSESTLNEKEIKHMILNGNDKGMMPYKDIIPGKEEINSLVDYVKSLRK
ncbi:MAG: c-type cytochrome [Bacteroidota bacterium]